MLKKVARSHKIMTRSAYWSVSVCIVASEKEAVYHRLQSVLMWKYVLIAVLQQNEKFVMADIYIQWLEEKSKTQVMELLNPLGLMYPKRSLKAETKTEFRRLRDIHLANTIEFGFFNDPQPELEVNYWNGDIAKDQRSWELEQEEDLDDPEEQPKVSIRKQALRFRRTDCPKRTTYIKRILTEDGDIDDVETHKRKQRRLETEARNKLKESNEIVIETETEPDLK